MIERDGGLNGYPRHPSCFAGAAPRAAVSHLGRSVKNMNAITIEQDRCNAWTAFGVFMAIGLFLVSVIGMVLNWPFTISFEWSIILLLFVGSFVASITYISWIVSPKKTIFFVSQDEIRIEDQPSIKWATRTFSPSDVVELSYNGEGISELRTRDGKSHVISDILMIQRDAIFDALSTFHPHIIIRKHN